MRSFLIGVFVLALSGGCAHVHWCDSSCEKRAPDVVNAVQAAGIAVHERYGWSPPANFDARAYLAAARAGQLLDWQLSALESVELEVWTKADCRAAYVVARCPDTRRAILADDTATTSRVDEPNLLAEPEAQLPEHPTQPPACPVPPPVVPRP